MPIDKLLQKIQIKITEVSGTMEAFVEETIQPSVADCDNLRRQMNDLLEELAVYKHFKLNNELSPSFNIHAKISKKEPLSDEEADKEPAYEQNENKQEALREQFQSSRSAAPKNPLVIGINDKFRFINELFSQNASEYHIVLEQLSNLNNWHETEIYLNSLKNVYGWKDNSEAVKYFYGLTKRRFE